MTKCESEEIIKNHVRIEWVCLATSMLRNCNKNVHYYRPRELFCGEMSDHHLIKDHNMYVNDYADCEKRETPKNGRENL